MKATAVGQTGLGSLVLLCAALAGCSSSHVPKDGGSKDGSTSMDGSADEGGFIRRRDAQITSGDPIPPCMRFDPMPCGAGQQCQLVIRRAADAGQFTIYSGCVEGVDARPLGAPCDQWGGQGRPYAAEGLQDEVYVDPCAQGLYCAADPKVRGHYSCQRSCESGRRQGQTEVVACPSPTQYCTGSSMATGLEEVCRDSDACDPSDPTSCGPGRGCYLRLNDGGTGVLSVCLAVNAMPISDGVACQYLNDCRPGSSCWGPARLPPSRWMDSDLVCHRNCDTSASGGLASDAGDEDGGPGHSGAACRGRTTCTSFSGSGLSVSSVSVPVGQCE